MFSGIIYKKIYARNISGIIYQKIYTRNISGINISENLYQKIFLKLLNQKIYSRK